MLGGGIEAEEGLLEYDEDDPVIRHTAGYTV